MCCEVGDIGSFVEELQQRLDQKYKAEAFNPVTLSKAGRRSSAEHTRLKTSLLCGTIINDREPLKLMEANMEVLRRRGLNWVADCPLRPNVSAPYPVPYCPPFKHQHF